MRGIKLYGAPFNKEGSLEPNDEVVTNEVFIYASEGSELKIQKM